MSKALVIPNCDFSANKVTTVTISSKACTGVDVTPSTLTITQAQYGDSAQISVAVTPADTTDQLVLTSSNINVIAIINSNAKVVGIGEAMITATCGNYSDSCTVTVESMIPSSIVWGIGYCADNADVAASIADNVGRFSAFGAINNSGVQSQTKLPPLGGMGDVYTGTTDPIDIPLGATQITISETGMVSYASIAIAYYDGTLSGSVAYPNQLVVKSKSSSKPSTGLVYDIPSGMTAFTIGISDSKTYDYDTDIEAVAAAYQLAVTFS